MYLFHIITQGGIDMEKQLELFGQEEKRKTGIWYRLPEEKRSEIEMSFANLLIRYLCQAIEENTKK